MNDLFLKVPISLRTVWSALSDVLTQSPIPTSFLASKFHYIIILTFHYPLRLEWHQEQWQLPAMFGSPWPTNKGSTICRTLSFFFFFMTVNDFFWVGGGKMTLTPYGITPINYISTSLFFCY